MLAWQIGETWDARSTSALITGLVAVCGGGGVLISMLLALIIGIPFSVRLFRQQQDIGYGPTPPAYPGQEPRQLPGWAHSGPPQLADSQAGDWQSLGPGGYDVWETDSAERMDFG